MHNVVIAWSIEKKVVFVEARVVMVTSIIAQLVHVFLVTLNSGGNVP